MKASTRTRVHFTSTEWNLAKKGINALLKQKDKISDNVYQTISDIYKNVFSKGITFVDETVSIGIDEFDNLMKEIDDEAKEETKDSKTSTESYCEFDKVMFCLGFNYFHLCLVLFRFVFLRTDHDHKIFWLQNNKTKNYVSECNQDQLAKMFCSNEPRDVKTKLEPNLLASSEWEPAFLDYLSINKKLIYGELRDVLFMYSKNNKYCKQDLNYLYQNIRHNRNECSLFTTDIEYVGRQNYVSMINIFDKHKNDTLKMFCMIFNAIANILLNQWYTRDYKTLIEIPQKSQGEGFDAFIFHHKGSLTELLKEYIINRIAQTSVFDTQKNSFFSSFNDSNSKITNEEIKTKQLSNEEILLSIKKLLFSNDNEFSELVEYCIKDIKSGKTNKYKSIYQIVANDCRDSLSDIRYRYGISCFIINRLSHLLFSELMKYERNDKNEKELKFPSLSKFYKFMYNCSIYFHCYTQQTRRPGGDVFFLREYYNLTKHKWYSINIGHRTDMQLKDIQYKYGNTLLHASIGCHYSYYSKLLIRDNFNCMHKNDRGRTPFRVAELESDAFVLELMNSRVERNVTENSTSEFSNEMDDKSIELRYNSFMNQISFSKYFIAKIGIENEKKTHDEYITEDSMATFYVGLKDLVGLKKGDNDDINDGSETMKYIVNIMIALLKLKVVLSDDLLVLCAIYDCNTITSVLIDIIKECLLIDSNHQNVNLTGTKHDDSKNEIEYGGINDSESSSNNKNPEFSTRNYIWFKHYLLDSNVWFVKYKSNEILFDKISNVIEHGLFKQKKFIWDHFAKQKKANKQLFNDLCMFDIKIDDSKHDENENTTRLRQDKILNGIKPERNELSVLLLEAEVGNNSKDGGSTFNIAFENNTKVYSTQCLTFAHSNNSTFQNEMKQYFSFDNINIECEYQSAPVKTYDRILVKATSDYGNESYPSVSNILDFMRFSVTFDNINDLLTCINQFIKDINNNKISCLDGILRIKNGFSDIINCWKSIDDAGYRDIKLNIIYKDSKINV